MGIALFLRAQIAAMRYVREQLDELNFLERFLAEITFLWRTVDERLVLAIGDVPESFFVRSELASNALGMIAIVLLLFPLLLGQRGRSRRRAARGDRSGRRG